MKEDWEIKKLHEISSVSSGNPAPQKKELFVNGIYPFIRTSDVGKIKKGIIDSCVDYLNKDGVKGLKLFKKGTILFPKSGASTFLNHRVMMEIDGFVSSHLATIKANNTIAADKYILYFLTTIDARNLMQDIAYPSLKTSDIGLIEIPLPPLREQQRIVTILDEIFAAIAKAKANAEQNLKNARELFESYLQSVFTKKGDGWEEMTLGEVLVKTETVDPTKKPNVEFIYLDVSSVNKETKEIENATIVMGKDAPSRAKKLVKTNDVIFATVRPTHSRVALITEEYNGQVCSTGYFVLRAKDFLINNLVYYFLLTSGFNKQMEKLQKGASYPAVTDSEVKSIIIPFPKSVKEQNSIVQKLDSLSSETKKLEAIYHKKLNDLEELKKSILQRTFNGELKTA